MKSTSNIIKVLDSDDELDKYYIKFNNGYLSLQSDIFVMLKVQNDRIGTSSDIPSSVGGTYEFVENREHITNFIPERSETNGKNRIYSLQEYQEN